MTTTEKDPQDIYIQIAGWIEQSIAEVESANLAHDAGEHISQAAGTSLEVLGAYRDSVDKDLEKLRQVSEWDVFTISLYGETNAGKSTIIETLRILQGEAGKAQSQASFRELAKGINLDGSEVAALQKAIQDLSSQTIQTQALLQETTRSQQRSEQLAGQAIERQRDAIRQKIETLGLLQKIVHWFKKLDEENQLGLDEARLRSMQDEHREAAAKVQAQLQALEVQSAARKQDLQALDDIYEKLAPHQDGAIIGDGRSDFTLASQSYAFEVSGQKFALIDVPGIEGTEDRVSEAIYDSVKKSHAVFYITPKAAPPNKGEGKVKGTLEKIKEHLDDQTEVWSVFNKRATNPQALKKEQLLDEGELGGIQDLETHLKAQLGPSYQGSFSLSALPAFYAATDCLLPTNAHYKARGKFIGALDREALLEKSRFAEFARFISQDICSNYKEKILRANLRKIKSSLERGHQVLDGVIENFRRASKDLERQLKYAHGELDKISSGTCSRIESTCHDGLAESSSKLRKAIHDDIDKDIGNEQFEAKLREHVDGMGGELKDTLARAMEVQQSKIAAEVEDVLRRFDRNASEILDVTLSRPLEGGMPPFGLEFKLDNGINTLGLLSAFIGGAALLLSNPAGWVMLAIGAVSLLFNFYKAVRGFFSSDYKKAQQRKWADENIARLFDSIKAGLRDNVDKAAAELQGEVDKLKKRLSAPLDSVQRIAQSLSEAGRAFKKISRQFN
ncbi:hypothetical protein [Variovorax ginsengisoli]|uniref:G domain-containing protein n=1 Tax=Variovorax ginsengisoli TaxID=363844 RepID=A0ABT8SCD0_9BURK|nr:hypothetical protein [Variovorax ginsengisoli]MDN8617280.1 hypothetical protein [Variovorax ginsengisoli]MDO1536450.1 hypothetical protein [Variovorax ginsengisoli]